MDEHAYTQTEQAILDGARRITITDEEFISLYNKAVCKGHMDVISYLHECYPDVLERVFSPEFAESHFDQADMEFRCKFPVLIMTNRYSTARVMNMVAYLLGMKDAPAPYRQQLKDTIPYKLAYNYVTSEYVEDFCREALWEQFFMAEGKLSSIIKYRSIKSLDELVDRTSAYYEEHQKKNSSCRACCCTQCQQEWMEHYGSLAGI